MPSLQEENQRMAHQIMIMTDIIQRDRARMRNAYKLVRLSLGFCAVALFGIAWLLVFVAPSSLATKILKSESKVPRNTFYCALCFEVFFIFGIALCVRRPLRIHPRVKIMLQAFFVAFSVACSGLFSDVASYFIGLSLSFYTLPLFMLLRLGDDVGCMEASIGMSIASIIKVVGDDVYGWAAVFLHVLMMMMIRYDIYAWYSVRYMQFDGLEEEER